MGLVLLTERHAKQIAGVLSCYDRMIVQGTLPVFCYADGMTAYLSKRRIRIFDFTQFAKPLTDAIKANAENLAAASGLTIDYVRKKNFRKEDKVKAVLKERGSHPGLVWILSALEPCTTYQPWHRRLLVGARGDRPPAQPRLLRRRGQRPPRNHRLRPRLRIPAVLENVSALGSIVDRQVAMVPAVTEVHDEADD